MSDDKNNVSRRDALKGIAGIGATLPVLNTNLLASDRLQRPMYASYASPVTHWSSDVFIASIRAECANSAGAPAGAAQRRRPSCGRAQEHGSIDAIVSDARSAGAHRHSSRGALLGEMLAPENGHGDDLSQARLMMPRDEATLSSVLPNRKTRAGGSPCVHHFGMRPRAGSDPFEQIEDQDLYRVRQRDPPGSDPTPGEPRWSRRSAAGAQPRGASS